MDRHGGEHELALRLGEHALAVKHQEKMEPRRTRTGVALFEEAHCHQGLAASARFERRRGCRFCADSVRSRTW